MENGVQKFKEVDGEWILDPLVIIKGKTSIKVGFDPKNENKKETIMFFQKGITNKDEYIINKANNWYCEIKIKIKPELSGQTENYTFASIVDYKNTNGDYAKYVKSNSVCKIRITY